MYELLDNLTTTTINPPSVLTPTWIGYIAVIIAVRFFG